MSNITNFLVENQMLIYAIICLLLAFVLCFFYPKASKKETKAPSVESKTPEPDVVDRHLDLDELLNTMRIDVDSIKAASKSDQYEDEEEKTAIISFSELLKANESEAKPVIKEVVTPSEAVKKFKNTEVISPIYGKVSKETTYPTVKKFEPKADEIDIIEEKETKDEVFLNSLKEFRSNLE